MATVFRYEWIMLMNVAQIHVSHIPIVWIIPWIDKNCSVNSGVLVFLNKQYLSTCEIFSTCWTRFQYNWVLAQYYAIWSTHFMLNNYHSYYCRWVMKQWQDINQDIYVSSLINLLNRIRNSVLRIHSHSIPWWRKGEWLLSFIGTVWGQYCHIHPLS